MTHKNKKNVGATAESPANILGMRNKRNGELAAKNDPMRFSDFCGIFNDRQGAL